MTSPSQRRTPALDVLLDDALLDRYGVVVANDGTPAVCPHCPFAGPTVEFLELHDDPVEAHYMCNLLERPVWGEEAPCVLGDWQTHARRELGR